MAAAVLSRSSSAASPPASAAALSHNTSATTSTSTSNMITEAPWQQMHMATASPALLPLSSIIIASLSCIFLSCIFLLLALSYFIRRRRRLFFFFPAAPPADCEIAHHKHEPLPLKKPAKHTSPPPPIRRFTLKQIRAITSDFRLKLQARPDGAALLYKGSLDGAPVLVRKVDGSDATSTTSFMASVSLASRVRHPNVAKLLGFCVEGNNSKAMMAVYEHVEGAEALDVLLSRPVDSGGLDWAARYAIAVQLAETLLFLHQEACLSHGDVRPENMLLLLQGDGIPKLLLAGFGHAAGSIINQENGAGGRTPPPAMETCGDDESSSTSSSRSAAEEALAATASADVYGFGRLLLLCLVMGKGDDTAAAAAAGDGASDVGEPSFLEWVYLQAKQGIYEDALDRRLLLEAESEEVRVCVELAFCCLQVEISSVDDEEEEEAMAMASSNYTYRKRRRRSSSRRRRRPSMKEVCNSLRHRHAMGLPLLASMAFGGGGRTTSDDSIDIDINSPPDLLLRSSDQDDEEDEEQVVVVDVDHVSSSSARRRSTTSPAAAADDDHHHIINHPDDLEPCYQVFSLRRFHGRSFS